MARAAKVREDTTQRVPLHEQRKNLLTVPEKKGMRRRFVNTNNPRDPNRVQRFLKAGYRIVEDETQVGDPGALNQNQSIGTGVRKDMGDGITAVLMEIESKYYDADQEAKMERLDNIEKAIYKDHGVQNSYGSISSDIETWGDEHRPKKRK